ncbi:MAG: transposase [Holosporales bacterium]|nr:transposase [Holosporales bacterium]
MDYRKGAYSVYDLKYHIIFCTKCRYRILTGNIAIRTRGLIKENRNI